MEHFRGKIMKDGYLVLDGVSGTLQFSTRGSLQTWFGQFPVPPEMHLGTGNYQLALEDGRSGDIVISSAVSSSSGFPEIHFRGSGPLQ